ncbi:MAG: hypothetical protein HC786_04895 [Richelia sp. CSU_2_1]|nr:hypothetical protein [Microcoleus sp. SU_5_6]NJL69522.1 hypothetical protein [Microcoleus sp. SM1_3_4]NJR21550.1 hypothetical protein [Richelia sp. CSU_2_1]
MIQQPLSLSAKFRTLGCASSKFLQASCSTSKIGLEVRIKKLSISGRIDKFVKLRSQDGFQYA